MIGRLTIDQWIESISITIRINVQLDLIVFTPTKIPYFLCVKDIVRETFRVAYAHVADKPLIFKT